MIKFFKTLILLCILYEASGQSSLGYQLFYRVMDYPNWSNKPVDQLLPGSVTTFPNHVGLGVEYTRQIRKTSLNSWVISFNADLSLPDDGEIGLANAVVQGGYRLYPFNQEDCDCPSFYQTGSLFSRGFNITPRAGVNALWLIDDSLQMLLTGGVDLGLDIPLNKKTTITPLLGFSATSYAENKSFVPAYQKSNINSINIGLKLVKHMSKRRY